MHKNNGTAIKNIYILKINLYLQSDLIFSILDKT